MKKFDITTTQKDYYNFLIEAETEKEAVDKAYKLFEEDKRPYYYDSDNAIEVVECET